MNKVKPFFIRITDDMTPQTVQDAFDKCVDAGAVACDFVHGEKLGFKYSHGYDFGCYPLFGVCDRNKTKFYSTGEWFSVDAQEITLDQLDEWLWLEVEQEWNGKGLPPIGANCEWKGKRGGYWVPCIVVANNDKTVVVQNTGNYKQSEFEVIDLNYQELRKPETPEQKSRA